MFSCKHCHESSLSVSEYHTHLLSDEHLQSGVTRCDVCNTGMQGREAFTSHLRGRKHHKRMKAFSATAQYDACVDRDRIAQYQSVVSSPRRAEPESLFSALARAPNTPPDEHREPGLVPSEVDNPGEKADMTNPDWWMNDSERENELPKPILPVVLVNTSSEDQSPQKSVMSEENSKIMASLSISEPQQHESEAANPIAQGIMSGLKQLPKEHDKDDEATQHLREKLSEELNVGSSKTTSFSCSHPGSGSSTPTVLSLSPLASESESASNQSWEMSSDTASVSSSNTFVSASSNDTFFSATSGPGSASSNFMTPLVNDLEAWKQQGTSLVPSDYYPFSRGLLLIFENEFHPNSKWYRSGSEEDRRRLMTTFQQLGFDVRQGLNLKQADLMRQLEDTRNQLNRNPGLYSTLVVYMGSHGRDNGVLTIDKGMFHPEDLAPFFGSDRCPGMAGRPKIFMINACRGSEENRVEKDGILTQLDAGADYVNLTDYLYVYATLRHHTAYRIPDKGSVFLQGLCLALKRHGTVHHFQDILTKLRAWMLAMKVPVGEDEWAGQMSEEHSTLTKFVRFGARLDGDM